MKSAAPIFYGVCQAGKLELPRGGRFERYLRSLEGPVEIIIRRAREQRSLDANAYYWKVIVPALSSHCGYRKHEAKEVHEALKKRFLREYPERAAALTTKTLDAVEFGEYLDSCIQFAVENGVVIPPPGELDY